MTPSQVIPGTYNYAEGTTGFVEVCVHPMEFVPDNTGQSIGPSQDHGGDDDHPVVSWSDRIYNRFDFIYNGLQNTHRAVSWVYRAIGYPPTADGGVDSTYYRQDALGPCVVGGFNHCEVGGIGETPHFIAGWAAAAGTFADLEYSDTACEGGMGESQGPAPWTQPYVYAAISISADPAHPADDDFTIAVAGKIQPENQGLVLNRLDVHQFPAQVAGFVLANEDELIGSYITISPRGLNGRPAGWSGVQTAVITCRYADLPARLAAAKNSGMLDTVFSDLPTAATDGTSWPQSRLT